MAKTFFRELRRRNVHKVALAYLVIAWLILQSASLVLFRFEGRHALLIALTVILIFGFAIALYISWAFEATPTGMKRTENVPADTVLPTWSRKKFFAFIIVTALLAASLCVIDRILVHNNATPSSQVTTP